MRPAILILLAILTLQSPFANAGAEEHIPSPARGENEDWRQAAFRNLGAQVALTEPGSSRSAYNAGQPYLGLTDVSDLPEWPGTASELAANFAIARDERVYGTKKFPRRATWLYPDDGCYARASHIARSFASASLPRPGRVFLHGDITLYTPYTPSGRMSWWYHVASAYRKGSSVIVLDPSVDATKPLTLAEWVNRLTRDLPSASVSLCDSYAYFPGHRCIGGSPSQERSAVAHLVSFLNQEWQRAIDLRLDPNRVLGSHPPWAK
jgi:hypothetical protein